ARGKPAIPSIVGIAFASRPFHECRQDRVIDHDRLAAPPVLPGEKAIPVAPVRARQVLVVLDVYAREGEIADRDDMRAGMAVARLPAAVAERVELLDIAERQARLLL